MEALYFTATWCQPCKVFGPIMDRISKDFTVEKINIEENMRLTDKYGVMSVPTVVFINEDKELGRFVGARTEDWVRDFIHQFGA